MEHWNVRVEWAGPPPSDDQLEQLHEQLQPLAGSVGIETAGSGLPSAQISVEAATVRQAFTDAVRAVEATCKTAGVACTVTGVEVLTEVEFDRRQAQPVIPPLVGFAEIAEILGKDGAPVSRQRAREIALERFAEVARTSSGPLFLRAQVERFAATWERKRGRPRKTAAPDRQTARE